MVLQNLEKSHSDIEPSLKSRNIRTVAQTVLAEGAFEYSIKAAKQAVNTADHYSTRVNSAPHRIDPAFYSEYCNTFSDRYLIAVILFNRQVMKPIQL